MKKLSTSPKETEQLSKTFLDKILKNSLKNKGATVVGLSGDLGAGKTAFTQYIGKLLGVKNKITSPTFVIFKKYQIKKLQKLPNYKFLIHIDAYRLKHEQELLYLGWENMINNKENLILVEWPENIKDIMPKHSFYIEISHGKDGSRIFKLQ